MYSAAPARKRCLFKLSLKPPSRYLLARNWRQAVLDGIVMDGKISCEGGPWSISAKAPGMPLHSGEDRVYL